MARRFAAPLESTPPADITGADIFELDLAEAEYEPEDDRDTPQDIQATVARMLEGAVRHFEEHVEPDLVEATNYYHARPFGDEREGRSRVVSSDVRDAVRATLPSLLRVFLGSDTPCEFRPRRPEGAAAAAQATDTVNYVIQEDNAGFIIFNAIFKDALIRRYGVAKWWVDERESVEATAFTDLSHEDLLLLAQDENVEIIPTAQRENGNIDATVRRIVRDRKIRYDAVPREEFIISPDARSLDSAPLVAHVRELPKSDLIAMGFDRELVNSAAGRRDRIHTGSDMESARQHRQRHSDPWHEDENRHESMAATVYAEAYILMDVDGDGIAERRLFRCIGGDYRIANFDTDGLPGEIVDSVPFAIFPMDPEPHTVDGLSYHDYLRDVQRVKSQVLRGTLNSLALALEQKQEVVRGQVNVEDLLNPSIGGIVRVEKPGMIREIRHEFLGPHTLPVLQYYDEIKENRTGQSRAAQGLDADSLQSATKAAVAATLTAAQQQIEMVSRTLAEIGMKRLFKGILKLLIQNSNEPRAIRLRGQYVTVDPRTWDAAMDVQVNVALGAGSDEQRLSTLQAIAADQMQLVQQGVPFVSQVEMRNVRSRIAELAGFRNPDEFYRPWGPEEEAQHQQMLAQQQPPPDPAILVIEVEQQKIAQQHAREQAELELEYEKLRQEIDVKRDEIARDFSLKEAELRLKYQQFAAQSLAAQVQADREAQEADIRAQQEAAKAVQAAAGAERAVLGVEQAALGMEQADAEAGIPVGEVPQDALGDIGAAGDPMQAALDGLETATGLPEAL